MKNGEVYTVFRSARRLSAAMLIGLSSAGCSKEEPLVPVQGAVSLDGKPADLAQIVFYPFDDFATADLDHLGMTKTDGEGRYQMTTGFGKPGLPPGKYRVTFSRAVDASGKALDPKDKPLEVDIFHAKESIPPRYREPETTPEIVEVPEEGLSRDFALTSR